MALTVVELKQTKKQLEVKEAEMSQAEQVAYDVDMTKSLKALLPSSGTSVEHFFWKCGAKP